MRKKIIHLNSIPAIFNSCLNDREKAELQAIYNDIMFSLYDDFEQPLSCETGGIEEFKEGYLYRVDEFNQQVQYVRFFLAADDPMNIVDYELLPDGVQKLGISYDDAHKHALLWLYNPVIDCDQGFNSARKSGNVLPQPDLIQSI
jgi:hypothetical protein